MLESNGFSYTPTKTYRVRRKICHQSISHRIVKIAKKVTSSQGLPKPLTCEEDFVIELKDNPADFLNPFSGFYELPEVIGIRTPITSSEFNPRNIVGSVENFKKQLTFTTESKVKELLKKNRTLMALTGQSLHKTELLNRNRVVPSTGPQMKNKIQEMHDKRQEYWQKINKNLNRQATINTRIKRKITNIMNTPIL